MPRFVPPGLGWHRDLPDHRDYGAGHEEVAHLLARLRGEKGTRGPGSKHGRRASSVCWEEFYSPAESQQGLNASSAYSVSALITYYEHRTFGRQFDGSPLFLYKMSRLLMQWSGDSGATLRDTIKALVRFGVPPRKFWTDLPGQFDDEPSAFLFSYAKTFEYLRYVRLDPPEQEPEDTLATVRSFVGAGFPVVFGVTVFDSIGDEAEIPFPSLADTALGGQALVAVGYDDNLGTCSGRGAFRVAPRGDPTGASGATAGCLIHTSGAGLAADFWTLLRPDWIEAGEFTAILT